MNLRKREILQRYQQGITDFQNTNLRGLSFKGEDLSDADFSFADIRGTKALMVSHIKTTFLMGLEILSFRPLFHSCYSKPIFMKL